MIHQKQFPLDKVVNLYPLFVMLMVHFPFTHQKSSHNFRFSAVGWKRQLEIVTHIGWDFGGFWNFSHQKNHRWPSEEREKWKENVSQLKMQTHMCVTVHGAISCFHSTFFFSHFYRKAFFVTRSTFFVHNVEDTTCSALISSHIKMMTWLELLKCDWKTKRGQKEFSYGSNVVVTGS